ncbi:enolase-phosphatase E1 [Cloeon dipterum]|uniref:enolase-phosphatase E1 n=1 Tax=Cloeon dipterum TaxID=197152 RepID=UPI00322019F9
MSSTPNQAAEAAKLMKNASAFLLDIEGTTTSISFVKDKLFPYVRENLATYLKENWAEASFQGVLKKLVEQAKADVEAKMEGAVALDDEEESPEKAQDAVKNNVLWMMDADRKAGALKLLQAQMYVKGYEAGSLKGHLYDDVEPQFKKWNEDGKKIYIYSSGNVEAQKLLFKNSEAGDVSALIADYFDTDMGAKVEKESYTKIAEKIGKPIGEVLFFTDIVKEADAATEAGMPVILLEREGNAPLTEADKTKYTVISSFKIEVEEEEVPAKKQKLDVDAKPAEEEKKAEEETMEVQLEEKKVEEKETETEISEEKKESNSTNGVHHKNGTEEKTNGSEDKSNGEEKESNGTEEKTNGESKEEEKSEESAAQKTVSPTKKVVTDEAAGDAPQVAAE